MELGNLRTYLSNMKNEIENEQMLKWFKEISTGKSFFKSFFNSKIQTNKIQI